MADKAYEYMDWPRIEAIVYGEEASPRDVMQPRVTEDGVLIQGFFPGADAAEVVVGEKSYPMILEDEAGYYAVMLPLKRIPEYRFRVIRGSRKETFYDAYECPCQITEEEERAFCAGVYYKAYEKLGAHPGTCGEIEGTYFAVWAPNAIRVSVVGDFDRWDGRRLPMHRMPMSGIFEIFVPGVQAGTSYQYEIKIKGGNVQRKSDPYGNGTQGAPSVISVVTELGDFLWQDEAWMKERERFASREVPVSIYETDVTEWKNSGELVEFLKETGYTHVEFHPVMEYLDRSSGGYSTSAYYAVTTRFGTAADFRTLVEDLHQAGIGVILDWVPAHFPRDAHGLANFDGEALYEHPDSRRGEHPDWGTKIFNYEKSEVRNFLIANALFWLGEYHVDGLRVDAVASMLYLDYGKQDGQWLPNKYGGNENLDAVWFFKHLNSVVHGRGDGSMIIAEESTAWPGVTKDVDDGGLGFTFKWNMGWMNDFLEYMKLDPYFRKDNHNKMTFAMSYAYSENYILVLSHDEVVHLKCSMLNKMPGYLDDKFANLKAGYTFMFGHPGKKLLFMGNEFAQLQEWSEARELDWFLLKEDRHLHMQNYVRALLQLYKKYRCLYELDDSWDGFQWINADDSYRSIFSFVRYSKTKRKNLLFVMNFTPMERPDYRVGVPKKKKYELVLDSDAEEYGGSGRKRAKVYDAKKGSCDNQKYYVEYPLSAYGTAVFEF